MYSFACVQMGILLSVLFACVQGDFY